MGLDEPGRYMQVMDDAPAEEHPRVQASKVADTGRSGSSAGMRARPSAIGRGGTLMQSRGATFELRGEGDDKDIDVDLESAGDLSVHAGVFLEFFLLHLLEPVSIPYVYLRYGWSGVRNLRLLWNPPRLERPLCTWDNVSWGLVKVMYDLSWLMLAIAIAIYAARGAQLEDAGVTFAELAHAILIFAVHRAMVGVKYATMTRGELRLFLAVPFERAMRYSERIQLLTGVWDPKRDMVYGEIARAWRHVLCTGTLPSTGSCAHTHVHSFAVAKGEEARWRAFLAVLEDTSPFARPGAEPPTLVRLDDVLCALTLRATARAVTRRFRAKAMWIARLIGVLFGLLPSCVRAWAGVPPLGPDPLATAAVLCLGLVTMAWWRTNVLFLLCSESWYRRTAVQREMLSALITEHDGFVSGDAGERASDWPTLRLSDPSTVRVYAMLWKLQMAYGRAYSLRMHVYNGFTCLVAGVFCAYLFYILYVHEGMGDEVVLRHSLPVNLMILLTFVLATIFYMQLRAGSRANDQPQTLQVHLSSALTTAHVELEVLTHARLRAVDDAAAYRRLDVRCDLVRQAISELLQEKTALTQLHELNPILLLGLRASMSLALTVGWTIVMAGIFLVDRMYGIRLHPYVTSLL